MIETVLEIDSFNKALNLLTPRWHYSPVESFSYEAGRELDIIIVVCIRGIAHVARKDPFMIKVAFAKRRSFTTDESWVNHFGEEIEACHVNRSIVSMAQNFPLKVIFE